MAWWFRRDPGATTGVASGVELLFGTALVSAAALAGLFFMHRPWPANLDVLGFRLLPADYGSAWAHDVTRLGSLPALLVGAAVILAVGLSRDRLRAIACATGPLLAALIVEEAAKPLVDRHLGPGGVPSYPSGTVAVVTALVTAAVLVVPPVLRSLTALAAVVVVAAACAAVVVLRWHFPTDAIGGVLVGAGIVLVLDGLAQLGRLWLGARWRPAART